MDLVNSLFGLPPQEQLRQQQINRDVGLGGLFAAATVNPYAAPAVQDAYLKQQQAQFALGSLGARGAGSLFGFQDPELQRVSTLEGILQGVSEEVDINNPVQFYPTLQKRLQDAGFSQEATQVGLASQEAIQNFAKSQSEIEAQKAMASQRTAQAKQIEADLESIPAKVEFVKENIKGISDAQAKSIAMDPAAIRELLKTERLGTPKNQAEQVILDGFNKQFPDNPVKAAEAFTNWQSQKEIEIAKAKSTNITANVNANQTAPVDYSRIDSTFNTNISPKKEKLEVINEGLRLVKLAESNPAAAVGLVSYIARMYDNGKLSNQDINLARNAGSVPAKLANSLNLLLTGTPSSENLADAKELLKLMQQGAGTSLNKSVDSWEKQVKTIQGLSPETINAYLEGSRWSPTEKPPKKTPPKTAEEFLKGL
jgi:hypothetical protein